MDPDRPLFFSMMYRLAFSLLLLAIFLPNDSQAKQKDSTLHHLEDSIVDRLEAIAQAKKDDKRMVHNRKLLSFMEKMMSLEGAFEHPFYKASENMGILRSPDDEFRLFTWNVPFNNKTHDYYAFILKRAKDGFEHFRLKQKGSASSRSSKGTQVRKRNFDTKSFDQHSWPPALYYRIIPRMKNDEKVYVLLGWEGHNGMTTKKVIETMKFEGDKIVFGVPMFEGREKGKKGSGQRRNTQLKKRVVFEYTDDAVMTVEYQKDEERIVFDHLEPEQSNLEGIYEFYGPTLSYDAYYWMDSGIWEFKKDIEVKNEQGDRKPYNDPGE